MNKVDPFEEHPDHPPAEKKANNVLTLSEFTDIIEEQIVELESLPPSVWGFTRDNLIEVLQNLKERAKDKT